jgi:integrase/recombinase XerD
LRLDQLDLRNPCSIHVIGKGWRERVLPLWKETVTALRVWLSVREQGRDGALFLNASGLTMTRSGFEYILATHVAVAAKKFPSIAAKRVTPHVLRHYLPRRTMSGNLDRNYKRLRNKQIFRSNTRATRHSQRDPPTTCLSS